ncbi:hypothetical protein IC006_0744 [Sulfuracidifex tepidarius]|uniref:Uncharacterized protein n=1 Tax=Sulfuracidifex tepidarius TaxID=1294262 RepID=A0A510E157_9CREN|nr:hypothetical protein IC006_0744 [Sulfuracidifex tepidarius]BBG26212.1 hypothetical protein IC007_0717 [Sulfuracidifex tepidarius]
MHEFRSDGNKIRSQTLQGRGIIARFEHKDDIEFLSIYDPRK